MRGFFSFFFIILFLNIAFSQDATQADTTKLWQIGGMGSLNFSQLYYGDHWSAGGEKSISGLAILDLNANYKKGNTSWDNSFDMNIGFTKLNGTEYRKSEDIFDISSKYGKKASKKWNYSASIGLNSQLLDGYNYPNDSVIISGFLAPGYILASLGMDYKPFDGLSMLLSPITGKITLVLANTLSSKGAFGVKPGENMRGEMGTAVKVVLNKEVFKNVIAKSKFKLFSNFFEHPENMDVEWEVLLTLKVNKLITTNISTHLIYDHDVIQKVQFKEFFGVGLTYKFAY